MANRTALLLDGETREAARQLAALYGCSISEAVRRAVVSHRDSFFSVSGEAQKNRIETLHRLFELFEGQDAEEEIRRLKIEDVGF